eukprot:13467839-Ditylum_brightwellii.AAC.1
MNPEIFIGVASEVRESIDLDDDDSPSTVNNTELDKNNEEDIEETKDMPELIQRTWEDDNSSDEDNEDDENRNTTGNSLGEAKDANEEK